MKQSCLLYTFVASVFLMLISGSLLTTGMFMDGLIYGNVADNMASGACTFWHPMHSPSLHADFYEHPPLVMGLLALFYKLFGTHVWVTRLFTMVTTVLTAWLTVRLWHRMGYERRTGWIPLLLWVLIPAMSRNAHDNMLECTMAIFVLAAVLSLLPREGGKRLLHAALGGLFLYLAFLCKGFTGLYPFALPMIVWVVDWAMGNHKHLGRALLQAVADTLMALGTFAVCFAATGLLFPDAVTYFETYLSHQVLGNLNAPTADSRWTIVKNFFDSNEFKKKNLSNEAKVKLLYQVMQARTPEAWEVEYWLDFLESGFTTDYVINGFATSNEFKGICDFYKMKPGTVAVTKYRDKNKLATAFVARCYTKALGRKYDETGIEYWCERLLTGKDTPAKVASGFVFSDEAKKKNWNNTQFLEVLYHLFFDREPDSVGMAYWLPKLNAGMKRENVVNGFASSDEFKVLLKKYNLDNIKPAKNTKKKK